MKAFKLASGFAVSALTLAIAGTAAAQATTEISTTGNLRVETVMDLENERNLHKLPGYYADAAGEGNEDWYNFSVTTTVNHGPFSGKVRVGIFEDEGTGSGAVNGQGKDNNAQVKVFDLRVDEGPISFGQIGRITQTAVIYENLTDETEIIGKDESTRIGVDAAARYTFAEFGLKVQAEGNGANETAPLDLLASHPFGFAAAIEQDLGIAKVYADAQYRQGIDAAGGMADAVTTLGAAAEVTPVDQVTLTAVFRNDGRKLAGDGDSVFALKADVAVTDTISVYGLVADSSLDADGMVVKGGFSAGIDAITVSASYEADMEEVAAGLILSKVEYTDGAIGAFVEANYSLEDFKLGGAAQRDAGLELVVGGSYTTESSVKYGAEYTNAQDTYFDNAGSVVNKVVAFAEYSF